MPYIPSAGSARQATRPFEPRWRDPHVDTILDFARRFPDVSFPIDDETGTTVSLLIVARDGVRTCAPSLMGKINSALPKRYQLPGPTD